MHIRNFEEEIHALILERGRQYFDAGAVHSLMNTPDGWTAEIKGTDEDTYQVIIHGHDDIEDWHCDCPYDHGPVCKHVVATLFAIREEAGKATEEYQPDPTAIGLMLDKLEGRALKEFLKKRMFSSPEFRQEFMEYFEEEE